MNSEIKIKKRKNTKEINKKKKKKNNLNQKNNCDHLNIIDINSIKKKILNPSKWHCNGNNKIIIIIIIF